MAITYDDLVALLKTRALNPHLSLMLLAKTDPPCNQCDLSCTTIVDRSVEDYGFLRQILRSIS